MLLQRRLGFCLVLFALQAALAAVPNSCPNPEVPKAPNPEDPDNVGLGIYFRGVASSSVLDGYTALLLYRIAVQHGAGWFRVGRLYSKSSRGKGEGATRLLSDLQDFHCLIKTEGAVWSRR